MDLSTRYMGLTLKNPLVVASSPISVEEGGIQRAIDAGAAAIVLYSLFEEQLEKTGDEHPYFPPADDYVLSPDAYFDLLHRTARRSGVPIIGSLNGFNADRLVASARKVQDAGAQGLELNT